jgi:hypothetical protein
MCTVDFLVKRGIFYVKASNAVLAGYGIDDKHVIMHNNIKHVPFTPTIRVKAEAHILKGSPGLINELEG